MVSLILLVGEWVSGCIGLDCWLGKPMTSCENQSCSCLSFPAFCVLWKRKEQARERTNKFCDHRRLDSTSGSRGHLGRSPVLNSDRSSIPVQTGQQNPCNVFCLVVLSISEMGLFQYLSEVFFWLYLIYSFLCGLSFCAFASLALFLRTHITMHA